MKSLRGAFVTGFLVLVPVAITIHLIQWFVQSIEAALRYYLPAGVLPIEFPGLRFLLALALVLGVGYLTQNYVGKFVVSAIDSFLRRITFIGGIYGGIKKFLETILNPRSDQFSGAVLLEFPRTGTYSIGFRTGTPDKKLTQPRPGEKLVNVFVPCTPNPTAGFYVLVREEELIPLAMSVQDAFRIVISMGLVTSEDRPGIGKSGG